MRMKSENRRLKIVAVAAEVFQERGYEATSMSEITTRVGGSKATIYSYFASKEELFLAVVKGWAEERMMQAFGSLQPSDDLTATLQSFGERFLRNVLSPDLIIVRSIVMGEGARSGIGKLFFESGPAEGWGRLAHFLAGVMEAGRLRQGKPWRAARHLINLLEADFLESFITGATEPPSDEQIVESVEESVRVFMNGYSAAASP
ncbi:TetR/AcrR family transcriptional regulator [Crenobacter sp. SG2303]|uniref:TetR/AcrR family transcriptional regulator n=1 Tax=Crenobacter oryzisoli TaxID=3056844 RepID=A0ABT7XS91_9NEIS|nr:MULTISPECIES: TetR/AcrR family transcriptional regulator [unclassified Crenobacter]MDN0076583.1 TetR/AcrR family transcriptional regulator [Crenobacter sp. SG2303]MDN0083291.1 TetR/AcrR family transcriptional regulator [Crenobacter sp. SG2305]